MEIFDEITNYFSYLNENYGNLLYATRTDTQSNELSTEETKIKQNIISKESFFEIEEEWIKSQTLNELEQRINSCLKCPLGKTRTKFVFGVGNPKAEIMFIGEAPGADEDLQGEPFVGRAGQLLTKILASFNIKRRDVYICNILKCRPPNNRKPFSAEMDKCKPYLLKQIELVSPKLIVALGATAVEGLFNTPAKMTELRGKVFKFQDKPVVITYHPAALLRNPGWESHFRSDIQFALEMLNNLTNKGT